jgi:hypothetical protein
LFQFFSRKSAGYLIGSSLVCVYDMRARTHVNIHFLMSLGIWAHHIIAGGAATWKKIG